VRLEGGGNVIKPGSQLTFFEFPLTKCVGSDDGLLWTCPQAGSSNPGWLSKSSPNEWQWLDSTNGAPPFAEPRWLWRLAVSWRRVGGRGLLDRCFGGGGRGGGSRYLRC
jgi:hypothetical protein